MTRPLAAIAALVALAAVGRADDQKLPGPKINWPDVKGLDRQKPNVFRDAGLGYSISYFGSGATITVYVYDMERVKIAPGPNSDEVKAEMYESVLALEANRGKRYKSISPLDEGVVRMGEAKTGPEIRRKRYEADIEKEGLSITSVYLTGYKNQFVKVRVTYPKDSAEECEKLVDAFLAALGKELK